MQPVGWKYTGAMANTSIGFAADALASRRINWVYDPTRVYRIL